MLYRRVVVHTVECDDDPRESRLASFERKLRRRISGIWRYGGMLAYRIRGGSNDVLMVALPTDEPGYARLVYSSDGLGARERRSLQREIVEESGSFDRPLLSYLDLAFAVMYADEAYRRAGARRPRRSFDPDLIGELTRDPSLLDDPARFRAFALRLDSDVLIRDELPFQRDHVRGVLHRDGRLVVPEDCDPSSGYLEQVLDGLVERAQLERLELEGAYGF